MKKDTEKLNDFQKKLTWRKYTLAAAIILLLITAALVFIWLTQEQGLDQHGEMVIRRAAAEQLKFQEHLDTEPNKLTDEDFAKIIELHLLNIELTDLKLLEKFTNLKQLYLNNLRYPKNTIPKWMKILAKFGFIDLNKRFALDLSPLEKLNNLQSLTIISSPANNFKFLSSHKNLHSLNISRGTISNMEPIKNLSNLRELILSGSLVSDLEPLKGLINLQWVDLRNCSNITSKQVEDLLEALPNVEITR